MNGAVNPNINRFDKIDSKIRKLIEITHRDQHDCWNGKLEAPAQLPKSDSNPFHSIDRYIPIMSECIDGFRSPTVAVLVRNKEGNFTLQNARLIKFFNNPDYVWRNDEVLSGVIGWKPLF